jgi:nuclear transport factor 2 (NTF2) superfamily protein
VTRDENGRCSAQIVNTTLGAKTGSITQKWCTATNYLRPIKESQRKYYWPLGDRPVGMSDCPMQGQNGAAEFFNSSSTGGRFLMP